MPLTQSPPRMGRVLLSLRCNLRDFPDKVINAPDFLHLLTVHLLNHADQNPSDELIQNGLHPFFFYFTIYKPFLFVLFI